MSGTVLINTANNVLPDGDRVFYLKLIISSVDGVILSSNPTEYAEIKIVIVDDDSDGCGGVISVGTFNTNSTDVYYGNGSGPYTISDNPVDITNVSIAGSVITITVDDITFGFYPLGYGDPKVSGVMDIDLDTGQVVIDEAQSPDTVYPGDSFFGSGTIDLTTCAITVSWSNHYGDTGVATMDL